MALRIVETNSNNRVDRFGAIASSLCAVHCAVAALLPAAFGALGLGILLGHEAEWIFTIVAIAFAVGALVLGWRRHRSGAITLLLALGISGLLASRGLEMGSDHHDHHAGHEAIATEHGESGDHGDDEAEHAAEPDDATVEPSRASHLTGTAVGVFAGMLLLTGHLLNLRALRRRG